MLFTKFVVHFEFIDSKPFFPKNQFNLFQLLDFLFQNEPIFCSNISKYRYVAETFSMCDFLTGDWTTRKSLPEDYVAQMATRSVMWNNYKERREFRPEILKFFVFSSSPGNIIRSRTSVKKLTGKTHGSNEIGIAKTSDDWCQGLCCSVSFFPQENIIFYSKN